MMKKTLLIYFFSLLPLFADGLKLTTFLKELRSVDKTHISLEDSFIDKAFESNPKEFVKAVFDEMKNTPHTWVIKECLNVAKVIGNHPKNNESVFPMILMGLDDVDSGIRKKSMLCLRVLRDEFSRDELKKTYALLATILCYDLDPGTRGTAAKTIASLKLKPLTSALITALKQETHAKTKGILVSTLKKVTGVTTIYGMNVKEWEKWYKQNKFNLGDQIIPKKPPYYDTRAGSFTKLDVSNPKATMFTFGKCLSVKEFGTINQHLFSKKNAKKGKEKSKKEKERDFYWACQHLLRKQVYYNRFFKRFRKEHNDKEMVKEDINYDESYVEFEMEQLGPKDRFHYAKLALEFELIRVFANHNIAADDKPDAKSKKKRAAEKKIKALYAEATGYKDRNALSKFFKKFHDNHYASKKFTPPIRQFYVLSEFDKKNRKAINELLAGDFTPILKTYRGYEFYYCVNDSNWKIVVLR